MKKGEQRSQLLKTKIWRLNIIPNYKGLENTQVIPSKPQKDYVFATITIPRLWIHSNIKSEA